MTEVSTKHLPGTPTVGRGECKDQRIVSKATGRRRRGRAGEDTEDGEEGERRGEKRWGGESGTRMLMRVRGEGRKRREENIDLRQENRRQHRTEEGAFYTARTTVRSVAAVDEEEEERRSRPFNLSCGSFFSPLSRFRPTSPLPVQCNRR